MKENKESDDRLFTASSFPVIALAFSMATFSFSGVVVITMSRLSFWRSLPNGGIVVIYDNNRVASLSIFVLGMARVGSARVVRIVCVLGPAFFIPFVVAAAGFAVFNDNDLAGIAVFLAGGGTRRHGGYRQYNKK